MIYKRLLPEPPTNKEYWNTIWCAEREIDKFKGINSPGPCKESHINHRTPSVIMKTLLDQYKVERS